MVDVTPRLEEYVAADVAACCPTLDGTVASLEDVETSVGGQDVAAELELLTGGTRPADHVHESVLEAMDEVGLALRDRSPRTITVEETRDSEYIITMGCSAEDVCPAGWAGESRDWNLEDPDDKSPETVREIRDEIEDRVDALIEEIRAADGEGDADPDVEPTF